MVDNIKTYFRLLKIYGKMDILWFLRDTKYCLLYMFSDLIGALATIGGISLIATRFDGFGGMNQGDILFMLSYGLMVDGLYNLFFQNNNAAQISRIIARGHIDHFMIQPVPILTQILTMGFAPISGISVFLGGMALMVYAHAQLGLIFSVGWLLQLLGSLLASVAIMLSIIYIISITAFYTPVSSEEIAGEAMELTDLKNYPLGGFSSVMQWILVTILPVGFAAWIPSLSLLGKEAAGRGFRLFSNMLPIVTIIMVAITSLLFRKGMIYYAKDGNPRYSGFGHR